MNIFVGVDAQVNDGKKARLCPQILYEMLFIYEL